MSNSPERCFLRASWSLKCHYSGNTLPSHPQTEYQPYLPPPLPQPLSIKHVAPPPKGSDPSLLPLQRSKFRESCWKLTVYGVLSLAGASLIWQGGWVSDTSTLWKGWPEHDPRWDSWVWDKGVQYLWTGVRASASVRHMTSHADGCAGAGTDNPPSLTPPLSPALACSHCTTLSCHFTWPAPSCWSGGKHGARTSLS